MLPDNVRTRRVHHGEQKDEDVVIREAEIVDEPATYACRLTDLDTGKEEWVNADDERTHRVTKKMFKREEDDPITHTFEFVRADGEIKYGPTPI